MKLRNHLSALADAVAPLDTPERRARYLAGDFPRADAVQDLSKRYRWDLYYASGYNRTFWSCDDEDHPADAHIDTILRRVVPALSREDAA